MFMPVVIIVAVALAVVVVIGIVRWQQPLGKNLAVIGGLLLVVLAAITIIVLYLAGSAQQGAPL